jgi:hypothetical protein
MAFLQEAITMLIQELPRESYGTIVVALGRLFVRDEVEGLGIKDKVVSLSPGRSRRDKEL